MESDSGPRLPHPHAPYPERAETLALELPLLRNDPPREPASPDPANRLFVRALLVAVLLIVGGVLVFQRTRLRSEDVAAVDPAQALSKQRFEVERRVLREIPEFRAVLEGQFRSADSELRGSSQAVVRASLTEELSEIARLLLALDKYEMDCLAILSKMRSAERQLERFNRGQDYLGKDFAKLKADISSFTAEASLKLSTKLDQTLGAGPIQDSLVMQRIASMRNGKEEPATTDTLSVSTIPDPEELVRARVEALRLMTNASPTPIPTIPLKTRSPTPSQTSQPRTYVWASPEPARIVTPAQTPQASGPGSLRFSPPIGSFNYVPRIRDFDVLGVGGIRDGGSFPRYLHGEWQDKLRLDPTFRVTYETDGTFRFYIEKMSDSGRNSLSVLLDNAVVQSGIAPRSSSWISIPVPKGRHTIQIRNTGMDWFIVTSYGFDGIQRDQSKPVSPPTSDSASTAVPGGGAASGYRSLFNGRDLAGWVREGMGGQWKVIGGSLTCGTGNGGGWLRTEREYANFDLRVEFRLSSRANSGIFLRAPVNGDPAYNGLEVQLIDHFDVMWKDIGPAQMAGSLYDVAPSSAHYAMKPANQWNVCEIHLDGTSLEVRMNGSTVLLTDLKRYASQTNKHPGLLRERGYIGLQDMGWGVEFRRVEIRELP